MISSRILFALVAIFAFCGAPRAAEQPDHQYQIIAMPRAPDATYSSAMILDTRTGDLREYTIRRVWAISRAAE
jgi:hypothetical protein